MLMRPYRFAAVGSYIVDDYSPKAAYGLRKLSSTATNAIRVRRSSDSAEQDIGFSGDDLDTSSLETFCSGTDGFVAKWYDQSGNSNDGTQAGASNQPRIVSGGTTDTDSTNSLPAMWCDATNSHHFDITTGIAATQELLHTIVMTRTSGKYNGIIKKTTGTGYSMLWFPTSDNFYTGLAAGNLLMASETSTGLSLVTVLRDSSDNVKYWIDNSAGTTKTATFSAFDFGTLLESNSNFYGHVQEILIWDDDQESNRTDIQDNMNSYYSAY